MNKIIYFLIGSLFLFFFIGVFINPIGTDSSLYITAPYLIKNGIEPFIDYDVYYTPLSFYMMTPFSFINGINYWGYLFILYSLQIFEAFLVYRLSKGITKNQQVSVLIACFFLIWVYNFEGYMWNLETFLILFILIALVLLQKRNVYFSFIIGVSIACSFLVKQYALLFFPVFFLLLLSKKEVAIRNTIYSVLLYVAGFLFIIMLFTLYFTQYITINELIDYVLGRTKVSYNYGEHSVGKIIGGALELVLFIIPVVLYLLEIRSEDYKKMISEKATLLICVFGIILCSFQFYFQVYFHYYINALPLICMVFMLLYNLCSDKYKYLLSRWLIFLNIIGVTISFALFFSFLVKYDANRGKVQRVAEKIIEIAPNEKEIFLDTNYELYFMTQKVPSKFSTVGFIFYQALLPEQKEEMKNDANIILSENPNFVSDPSKYKITHFETYYIYQKQ